MRQEYAKAPHLSEQLQPGDRVGVVYTETLVHSPTPQFANEVPYQLAIIELENGRRLTGRIHGERVAIGDRVNFVEFRAEVPYFQKTS